MSGRQRRASAVDLLPRETDADVAEAIAAAHVVGNKTQMQALETLNAQLAAAGIGAISKSSWHRFLARLDEEGVPPRWRSAGAETIAPTDLAERVLDALIELIDARIATALKRNGEQT